MSKWLTCMLLLAASAVAEEPKYIPLADIRPGMQGYGETVFEGTKRERFTFVVRSVIPGTFGGTARIIVGLTGCPDCSEGGRHMFEHTQIYGGMSGSSMYVVDPATGERYMLGGLVAAKDFATTAKTLVTPIEYQYDMAALLPKIEHPVRSTAEPGDYSATCLVYGDNDWCFRGTITARREGRLFLMGHDVAFDEKHSLPYGETDLPVFLIPVADILQSQESPSKLGGVPIAPIGSAVVHGAFGFVLDEGREAKTVPVTLSINGVFPQPVTFTFHMAYHKFAPSALVQLLYPVIANLPGEYEGSHAEVTVRVRKPAYVYHLSDSFETAAPALKEFLKALIEQEKKELDVEDVRIDYTPLKKMDYWQPVKFVIERKGGKDMLSVFARRARDNETQQMTEAVDSGPLAPHRQKKFLFVETKKRRDLDWWDGATLQDYILGRMPVREAFALLAQIQEREALYLVYGEYDQELKTAGTADRSKHLPEIRILMQPKFGGAHFYLPKDENGVRSAVKFENR